MNALWIVFATVAMFANAGSNLLQRVANHQPHPSLRTLKGVHSLARSPAWIGGFMCLVLSLVTQLTALSLGSFSGVETLLVLELPVAVIGGVVFFGSKPRKREWAALVTMTLATVVLIVALNPHETGTYRVSGHAWLLGSLVSGVLVLVPVLLSLKLKRPVLRAALRGIATGIAFALAAAYSKGMTIVFLHDGLLRTALSWELYAALATAALSIWLLQFTLRSGKLIATQPGITLASPYMAIGWGVLAFHERIRLGDELVVASVCMAVLSVSAVFLAASLAAFDDN